MGRCGESIYQNAWLPDECVAIPFVFSLSVNAIVAQVAPLILKAPIFWKFSHLKKIDAPVSLLILALLITGV